MTEPILITPSMVHDEEHLQVENVEDDTTGSDKDPSQQLQDQTNLLPMKQLFVVFAGLSTAMLCKSF